MVRFDYLHSIILISIAKGYNTIDQIKEVNGIKDHFKIMNRIKSLRENGLIESVTTRDNKLKKNKTIYKIDKKIFQFMDKTFFKECNTDSYRDDMKLDFSKKEVHKRLYDYLINWLGDVDVLQTEIKINTLLENFIIQWGLNVYNEDKPELNKKRFTLGMAIFKNRNKNEDYTFRFSCCCYQYYLKKLLPSET